jgi:hypothetical protein
MIIRWDTKDHLELKENVYITAITKEQFEAIMYIGKNIKKIAELKDEERREILNEATERGVRVNISSKTFKVKGEKIHFTDVLLIGKEIPSSAQQERYFKSRVIRGIKYFYHYGRDWYDYYGTGIEEFPRGWDVVKSVVGINDYYLIYKIH